MGNKISILEGVIGMSNKLLKHIKHAVSNTLNFIDKKRDNNFLKLVKNEPYEKTIIVLSNSRKFKGHCVAGKDIKEHSWIRPVSERVSEEVSEEEQKLANGSNSKLLDIISISFKKSILTEDRKYQTENHLFDHAERWKKIGEWNWSDLDKIKDEPETLWINGCSSSKGKNDRIPENEASNLKNSLFLIYTTQVEIKVRSFYNEKKQKKERKVRALFSYKRVDYDLRVTDPEAEKMYFDDGNYILRNLYLCISLGEPFNKIDPLNKFCYKLVAGIIKPPEENPF